MAPVCLQNKFLVSGVSYLAVCDGETTIRFPADFPSPAICSSFKWDTLFVVIGPRQTHASYVLCTSDFYYFIIFGLCISCLFLVCCQLITSVHFNSLCDFISSALTLPTRLFLYFLLLFSSWWSFILSLQYFILHSSVSR